MRFSINGTRAFQISLLLLLIISAAQVSWWIVDQARRTEALRARLTELYTGDARAAEELHRLGADEARLKRLFSHLEVDTSGKIVVSPEALESLRLQRVRWLNQYGWEGGFFLVVLVVSMVTVWRALHQEGAQMRLERSMPPLHALVPDDAVVLEPVARRIAPLFELRLQLVLQVGDPLPQFLDIA